MTTCLLRLLTCWCTLRLTFISHSVLPLVNTHPPCHLALGEASLLPPEALVLAFTGCGSPDVPVLARAGAAAACLGEGNVTNRCSVPPERNEIKNRKAFDNAIWSDKCLFFCPLLSRTLKSNQTTAAYQHRMHNELRCGAFSILKLCEQILKHAMLVSGRACLEDWCWECIPPDFPPCLRIKRTFSFACF